MIDRRTFTTGVLGGAASRLLSARSANASEPSKTEIIPGEDVFSYVRRVRGGFDSESYKQVLGAANPFREGDEIVGVSAADEAQREHARRLLAETPMASIDAHPVLRDQTQAFIDQGRAAPAGTADWTIGRLREFLLESGEAEIKQVMPELSSQVIGCVVKLMNNAELIAVSQKVFNPLPGSRIGSRGYLGARVQPNSPTDNVDDIRWQVFDAWSYAVGDLLLGTNPVSSEPESVVAIQRTLQELLAVFQLRDTMPHCVLAHIDVQAEVERNWEGSTALWFQSIAGCDTANETFDISVDRLVEHASKRVGKYGMYFETGQGADFTNGHGHGFDMVLHEARKYGLGRALKAQVAESQRSVGKPVRPWVHVNDVAGFIGPEVFRRREQLVRCCLEDIVMGKLHGLCIGLDVCSTLHMDISLDDLDWCLDQIMPANPAYLMALPTKIDPMLGYLTTGFQDHVRLREQFGYRVDDQVWRFFQELQVIDQNGRPTRHFGDPVWVFQQYQRRKGDSRPEGEIRREGQAKLAEVRGRGVFVAERFGEHPWELEPRLQDQVAKIYADAKVSIWAEVEPEFVSELPSTISLTTQARDREDYILHPKSGERLAADALARLRSLKANHDGEYDVQIVVSDGLNALAITDPGHLLPYLRRLRDVLEEAGYLVAPEHLFVTSGRVRAGYRIGEELFGGLSGSRSVVHVIGERPGTGHHTFSIYLTAAEGAIWGTDGQVDHNITKVISGVATTATQPHAAADETARILNTLA